MGDAVTGERPVCPVNVWCAKSPGHEDGCSIIDRRQEDALGEIAGELSQQVVLFTASLKAFVREVRKSAEKTRKDFSLHPPAQEEDTDDGR